MGAFPRRWLVAVLAIGACERPAVERANDTALSTVPPPLPPPVAPVTTDAAWDTAAGPVFLVMGASPDQAAMIVPFVDTAASLDTLKVPLTPWRGVAFDFFRQGTAVGTASAGDSIAVDAPDDCSAWPALRVARGDSTGWTVAFPTGRFASLGVDSLAGLTPRDSLGLTRELARVASGAPGDTADAMRGLPYVVHRAWRTTLPNGRQLVMAEIDRTLNQEASPLHEHLLLVAERDTTAGSRWELAWSERMVGGEDTTESMDLIVIGTARGRAEPVTVFARYLGDGVIYAMLQRETDGRWRLRWTSPYVGC
jgi:hypothetical protein